MLGGVFVGMVVGLAVAGGALRWANRNAPQGRWEFRSCWFQDDRVVAEGRATPATILYEHITVEANGRRIEMIVLAVNPGGTWEAQDLASLKAQRRLPA